MTTAHQQHISRDRLLSLIATPEPFRTWLESFDRNHWVGSANDDCHCPLAIFVREELFAAGGASIGAGEITVWPYSAKFTAVRAPMSAWAQELTRRIDERFSDSRHLRPQHVLDLLDQMPVS